jgi:hypothetical protein
MTTRWQTEYAGSRANSKQQSILNLTGIHQMTQHDMLRGFSFIISVFHLPSSIFHRSCHCSLGGTKETKTVDTYSFLHRCCLSMSCHVIPCHTHPPTPTPTETAKPSALPTPRLTPIPCQAATLSSNSPPAGTLLLLLPLRLTRRRR